MADSNITKRAMAAALKELMEEKLFSKISVGEICETCGMNRKSFYYHFKDKYDLVNWIFDTGFIAWIKDERPGSSYDEHWAFIEKACDYFYQNRVFYRKAMQIKGQNSFSDHFREYIRPLLLDRLAFLLGSATIDEFTMGFLNDTAICAMERWLLSKDCIPAGQFVGKIKDLMEKSAVSICREITQREPS